MHVNVSCDGAQETQKANREEMQPLIRSTVHYTCKEMSIKIHAKEKRKNRKETNISFEMAM